MDNCIHTPSGEPNAPESEQQNVSFWKLLEEGLATPDKPGTRERYPKWHETVRQPRRILKEIFTETEHSDLGTCSSSREFSRIAEIFGFGRNHIKGAQMIHCVTLYKFNGRTILSIPAGDAK